MLITHQKTYKNLYSFIRMSLVNEADKESKRVFLNYQQSDHFYFDIFFPIGLKIFDVGDRPQYVIIAEGSKLQVNKLLSEIEFEFYENSSILVITTLRERDIAEIDYRRNNFYIFGRGFIDRLIDENGVSYLNFLIGEKDTEIKVINRENDNSWKYDIEYEQIELSSSTGVKYIIHEDTPELFSQENELLFKTFLNSTGNNERNKCALFIGNGASIPFGADNWHDMIDNLIDYLKPFYIDNNDRVKMFLSDSSYAISSFVQTTLFDSKLKDMYYKALYYCIYRKVNDLMFKEDTLVRAIALGKIKYPTLPLLTYNYDTFVERQYEIECSKKLDHILPQLGGSLPSNSVIHLHGYIGFHSHMARDIVLTDKEYFETYLDYSLKPSKKIQNYVLSNYYCLFVGSSMSDLFQISLINKIKDRFKNGRWCCFALMCFKDLSLNEEIHLIKYYRSKGIYLITVNSFAELPKKLATLLNVKF